MKKTFLTLSMGIALVAGMTLTSCGGEQKKSAEQTEAAEGEVQAKTELPADLKVYTEADLAAAKAGTDANVGFGKNVLSTLDGMMEGNTAVKALYFDHEINMIGTASFKNCTSLEAVYADNMIQVVGDEAFMGCTSLKEFKTSTPTYGLNAFDGCTSLETIVMKDGWKIREKGLGNCTALKTVILPMTIEDIEEGAFAGSNAIENLAVPYNFKDRMYTFVEGAKGIKNIYVLTPAYYSFPTTKAAKAFNKSQCTAYVPDAQVEDFKKDPNWAAFAAIKPLSESGYYNADCTIK
ncbi:MAG: leucine-rich repeat domain-containing protein [Bacteroidaceae bacterium]|nr:leucine-rich repeat domain-containing protein [Bacteroidaceae bacterium]